MRLNDVIWNEKFVAKIADKHAVNTDEVEEVLFSGPHVRRLERGKVKGEHVYVAYGKTSAGRYLVVSLFASRAARHCRFRRGK